MFYPIAPHICEEVWEKLGNKTMLAKTSWPEYNKSKVSEAAYTKGMSIEKIVNDVRNIVKIISRRPKSLFIYTIPGEVKMYNSARNILSERLNMSVEVFASNDPNKIDPDGKAKKAKPGKPGIYLT